MNYIEVTFSHTNIDADVITAVINELPFESFLTKETGLVAYILESDFDQETLKNCIQEFFSKQEVTFTYKVIEQQNWNKNWESNFEPIIVDDKIALIATFHKLDKNYPIQLFIDPKMSFGTGHHETTYTILQHILKIDCNNKNVLDYGSGTGVLGFATKKLGANKIVLIDYDEWAYENCLENTSLNFSETDVEDFTILKGTVKNLPKNETYDIILANITKNVILQSVEELTSKLNSGGSILLSGFYTSDNNDILNAFEKNGFTLINKKEKNKWSSLHLKK